MATIDISYPYREQKETATRKVMRFLADMKRQEGITSSWSNDICVFKGTGLQGKVVVTDSHIQVAVDLSLMVRPFQSVIRHTIEAGLRDAFASTADLVQEVPSKPALSLPAELETQAASADAVVPLPSRTADRSIEALIDAYEPGYSLSRPFYDDEQIFERDIERVFRRLWLYTDHASRIPLPGDYFLFEIAGESIVIIRDDDETIKAVLNVCTHRGSRICRDACGHTTRLVCPYHAWVFEKNGALRSARAMPEDFKREHYPLHTFAVEVVDGLIYINLSERPIPFENAKKTLLEFVHPHGFDHAKVAYTERYEVQANWKLVTENFLECYHCVPSHPEYCSVNAHARGNSLGTESLLSEYQELTAEWSRITAQRGHKTGFVDQLQIAEEGQPIACYRQPIQRGFLTLSKDGQPVAPLMGDFAEYDGGETIVALGPLHFISAACDHAVVFRFTPLSVNVTEVVLTWLVQEKAEEGVDYQQERLCWMWKVTTEQDKQITEDNQSGIHSRWYVPGRYAVLELPVQRFITSYLQLLR